jgi:hypothetical protein
MNCFALSFLLLLPALVHAEALTYTVTDATGSISAGGAVVAALGLAALLISIAVKMWKRFRSAA